MENINEEIKKIKEILNAQTLTENEFEYFAKQLCPLLNNMTQKSTIQIVILSRENEK